MDRCCYTTHTPRDRHPRPTLWTESRPRRWTHPRLRPRRQSGSLSTLPTTGRAGRHRRGGHGQERIDRRGATTGTSGPNWRAERGGWTPSGALEGRVPTQIAPDRPERAELRHPPLQASIGIRGEYCDGGFGDAAPDLSARRSTAVKGDRVPPAPPFAPCEGSRTAGPASLSAYPFSRMLRIRLTAVYTGWVLRYTDGVCRFGAVKPIDHFPRSPRGQT